MASRSLDDLTPDTRVVVDKLLQRLEELSVPVQIVSTLRTCSEQDDIYAQGRTVPGAIVTHAPGCRSWHVWGRAVDLFVLHDDGSPVMEGDDSRYETIGREAEKLGMSWGGRFGDPGHVEYHPGMTQSSVCPDPSKCEQLVGHTAASGESDDLTQAEYVHEFAQEVRISWFEVIGTAVVTAITFQAVGWIINEAKKR